ncbi:hypothetical protein [Streptomyces sp. NBC_00212]|uniref:hypothetical protein n=1 Tax=Streptomyces sp. NBC_00212 TaxID=2975684 RepID=UPI00324E437F
MITAPGSTRTRTATTAAVGLTALLLLTGCSQERDAVVKWPPATRNPQSISADQLGDAWPIKPQRGSVSCVKTPYSGFAIIFTTPEGKAYALNNVAQDEKGLPNADTVKTSPKTTTMWRLRLFGMQVCSVDRAKQMQSTPTP